MAGRFLVSMGKDRTFEPNPGFHHREGLSELFRGAVASADFEIMFDQALFQHGRLIILLVLFCLHRMKWLLRNRAVFAL